MSDALVHRGPNDSGEWIDAENGIALASRRLAILDLSVAGHQPMVSADSRYTLTFNGEIYNFKELATELEALGRSFRSRSDTEVMLASFSQWGVRRAVTRFNGMFAFALWDCQEHALHLGRDRLGEKPLYYGWTPEAFLFGSELKALKAHPGFRAEINRDALALFLQFNYVPAPFSIYRGVHKLLPGTILTLKGGGERPPPTSYWSVREVAERGVADTWRCSDTEAEERLDALLRDAVRLRLVSDVPLGAFLSGGIDSSTIVALMQAQSSNRVKTFTIGFHEEEFDEACDARRVSRHLGTEHTELYVTPEDAMAVIPKLPTLYDEPFSDSSQIPTFLLAQLAREHVTVALSGDGGDELFGGYDRYFLGSDIWRRIGWMPPRLRRAASRILAAVPVRVWNKFSQVTKPFFPPALRDGDAGDKLHKLADVLAAKNPEAVYLDLVSCWKNPTSVVKDAAQIRATLTSTSEWAQMPDFMRLMMYLDSVTYLPDDILVKVDRATMNVSLEARVPLIDHRVVEWMWKAPLKWRVRDGRGKWLLRRVLHRYVPQDLIERPKMGFGVPIKDWLRGPLRDWAEDLLDEKRLLEEGFLNFQPIRQKWMEHVSGNRNWHYHLWPVLMFQAWLAQEKCSGAKGR